MIGSSSPDGEFACKRLSWGGTFDNVVKEKELYMGAQACFVNSTSKGLTLSKECKSKFLFSEIVDHALALAVCGIPITTRSGIEVEDFSPVAMYLSQTSNIVHSIFFWVDIHCYVCVESIHCSIFQHYICNIFNICFTISENSMLFLLTGNRI